MSCQAAPPSQVAPPCQAAPPSQAAPPCQAAPPSQIIPPCQANPPSQAAPPCQATPPSQAAPPCQANPPSQAAPPCQAAPPSPAAPSCQLNPTIKITVDPKKSCSTVELVGCMFHVITDKEKVNYGLTECALKEAVARHYGGTPTDVYVKGPVPGYDSARWSEVMVNVVPISATVICTDNNTDVVTCKSYVNDKCCNVNYDSTLSQNVTASATNTWIKAYLVNMARNLNYDLSVGGNQQCYTKFWYVDPWGEHKTVTQTVTLKAAAEKEIALAPGKSAVSKLIANKGTVELEVVFEAKASGDVLCFYKEPIQGNHYWRRPLSSLGLRTSLFVKQRIIVVYYSDVKVELKYI